MKKRLRKKLHRGEFAPQPALSAHGRFWAERQRQRTREGYSEEHDDAHRDFALERAADCYAQEPGQRTPMPDADHVPAGWPWPAPDWKPTPADRERELVKAGALYQAEIDRLTRLEASYFAQKAANPPVMISIWDIEASKLGEHFDRVGAKQAAVATQLNEALLRRTVPTAPSGSLLASGIEQARQAVRALGDGRQEPWIYKWYSWGEGHHLSLLLWEYGPSRNYRYEADWYFTETGRLHSYQGAQMWPKQKKTLYQ